MLTAAQRQARHKKGATRNGATVGGQFGQQPRAATPEVQLDTPTPTAPTLQAAMADPSADIEIADGCWRDLHGDRVWRVAFDDTGRWADENGDWDCPDAYDVSASGYSITKFRLRQQPDGTIQVTADLVDNQPILWHIGRELGIDDYQTRWETGFGDDADQWAYECEQHLLGKMVERYGFDSEITTDTIGTIVTATATLPPGDRSSDRMRDDAQTAMYDRFTRYINEADPGTYGCEYPYGRWVREHITTHPVPAAMAAPAGRPAR